MAIVKRAQCEVLFDEVQIVVKALQRQRANWIAVLPISVADAELGQRVIESWDLFEGIDPGEVDASEIAKADLPICLLFGQDTMRYIRSVSAISGRSNIVVPPSELKDDNRVVNARDRIELPHGSDARAIGSAVRQAMALTHS